VKLIVLGCLFLGGLVLGVCGGNDKPPPVGDAPNAVAVSILTAGLGWSTPSVIGEAHDCQVSMQLGPVAARCRWDANPTDVEGVWRVVYHETWACREFAATKPGYPDCSEATGFHEWVFNANLLTNSADIVDETGQFPPDYAR